MYENCHIYLCFKLNTFFMVVSDEDASIPHQHRLSVVLLHMIVIVKRAFMIVIVKSDSSGPAYHRGETTNSLAMVTFWRTYIPS